MEQNMPLKVVYIDDEPEICQIFIDNFSSDSIEIKIYTDPILFLNEVENHELDLVILDYRFPNINGDQIAKALGSHIPKVLVSGDLTINLEQTYLRTFTKPFDFEEVEDFLNGLAAKKYSTK